MGGMGVLVWMAAHDHQSGYTDDLVCGQIVSWPLGWLRTGWVARVLEGSIAWSHEQAVGVLTGDAQRDEGGTYNLVTVNGRYLCYADASEEWDGHARDLALAFDLHSSDVPDDPRQTQMELLRIAQVWTAENADGPDNEPLVVEVATAPLWPQRPGYTYRGVILLAQ
ncbi:hypothetical protein [Leekyejoonella antrihumi]|uniref:Uncharacterized protein n=1 Tax=Leekyejoonella antrihumi TaxID=1660198 RepID=A0A563DP80_9MICO|nr:hypothetical protein [Leekyejoonella antrihumi]TWP31969.1 hypothetical protein FGL98_24950 [Leekyejoonella antrihumi]